MIQYYRFLFKAYSETYHPVVKFMLIFLVTWPVLDPQTLFHQAFYHASLSSPDIVLISNDHITLLELSVISNTKQHLLAANFRKEDHYSSLHLDLEHAGLSVELVTIEVGCLGHFLPSSVTNMCRVCHLSKHSTRCMFEQAVCLNKLLKLLFCAPIEFLIHALQSCGMLVNC